MVRFGNGTEKTKLERRSESGQVGRRVLGKTKKETPGGNEAFGLKRRGILQTEARRDP